MQGGRCRNRVSSRRPSSKRCWACNCTSLSTGQPAPNPRAMFHQSSVRSQSHSLAELAFWHGASDQRKRRRIITADAWHAKQARTCHLANLGEETRETNLELTVTCKIKPNPQPKIECGDARSGQGQSSEILGRERARRFLARRDSGVPECGRETVRWQGRAGEGRGEGRKGARGWVRDERERGCEGGRVEVGESEILDGGEQSRGLKVEEKRGTREAEAEEERKRRDADAVLEWRLQLQGWRSLWREGVATALPRIRSTFGYFPVPICARQVACSVCGASSLRSWADVGKGRGARD